MTEPLEHVDVLVVGAGLSGIGAACQLLRHLPGRSVAVLEARTATGGTWDLHRYPGVRSDSDMTTLGYSFAPWRHPTAIADGASVLAYLRRTAAEHGVDRLVRLGHRVVAARWDSAAARWTVDVELAAGGTTSLTCGFLHACTGYYRYDHGHTPAFAELERYRGRLVHPQHWPEDLDLAGARVVVIGSGATAVSLVPAVAARAQRTTLLQRSPGWLVAMPSRDPLEARLRRWLPPRAVHGLLRATRVALGALLHGLSRRAPALVGRALLRRVAARLPPGFDVATHFTPRCAPWDQRLCLDADGELLGGIAGGAVRLVTGEVEAFTPDGVRLTTGEELVADVVVTATGLELLALGGMRVSVDGADVDLGAAVAHRGAMVSGVPNLAFVMGYTAASWTLRADLVGRWVCRLLRHLDARGLDVATPVGPPAHGLSPLIAFTSTYVRRGVHVFPRQGLRSPWRLHQSYYRDLARFRFGPVAGDGLRLTRAGEPVAGPGAARGRPSRVPAGA